MTEYVRTRRRGLVTFVCSVQYFISSGLIYGFSVMYADLINVFSTSRLNSALIQGTFNLIAIGGGVLWTLPIKRFGIGMCMVAGSLLGCLGFVTSSFARNFQTIIVCTGVITGTGVSIGSLAPFVVVGMIYNEDPGFQLALLAVSGSLGQMTVPMVYEAFLTYYHWSGAFVLLASIALHGVPCGLLIYYSRNLPVSKDDKDASYSGEVSGKELLSPVMWLYIVIIVILFGTGKLKDIYDRKTPVINLQ
ncbi:monocarboxylate transporter 2-like [Mercenaria mercenaria]|uniref:monocarboxylate transporter 2-like n=1 Tax=Mercenaria mercenaria TaxID=6596 RepID=UPI00234EFE87|nr:monocarboxylate transporter 2-like [Mercenaria mercenaria]